MIVNGKEHIFEGEITVLELLEKLNLKADRVVVEVDLDIVNKDDYATRKLSADSKVEVISFVGGG